MALPGRIVVAFLGRKALPSSVLRPLTARNPIQLIGCRCLITKTCDSYFSQGSPEPLLGLTLGRILDNTAKEHGKRDAVVVGHQKIRKTYKELRSDVDTFGAGLLAIGLKPGDLVGIWSPNCYEWVVTQYAVAKVGMILVQINAAFMVREVQYCMQKVNLNAIVVSEKFKVMDYYKMLCGVAPKLPKCKPGQLKAPNLPSLTHVIVLSKNDHPGAFKFADVLKASKAKHKKNLFDVASKIQFDAPSNIVFTSGTTGFPKGATLTHHSMINNAYSVGKAIGFDKKAHRICNPLPLFHVYGCVAGSVATVLFGACHVMPSPMFHPVAVGAAVQQEKCTIIYGTPTMHIDLLCLPTKKKFDFSSVQYLFTGGANCPIDVGKKLAKHLAPTLNAYGCTEATCCALIPNQNHSIEDQINRGGRALDHVETKVVDLNGKIVPKGTPGELCVRGYLCMQGYWNDEKKTNEVLSSDRWYRTGDWVKMDDEGYVTIIARIKEMIIRGGENIYPKEIEDFFHTNPKIQEAQVIGVPDSRRGEEVCAWIKLKEGEKMDESELRKFCEGQIAHFKVPRYILFVADFPKTVTGKVQKFVMQEQSIKTLKLK